MAQENGMALMRTDAGLRTRTINTLERFIPRELRSSGAMTGMAFLQMASAQLEGKKFKVATLPAALMTFAMAGILPNKALGHGFLIPFGGVVTPVFGYKGLLELAARARPANGARVLGCRANTVQEGDRWDESCDIGEAIRAHRPAQDRDPRQLGDGLIGAYAEFRMVIDLGSRAHEYRVWEWMPAGEIWAAKASSAAVRAKRTGSPWFNWPERMARVAVIRRACRSGVVPLGYLAGSVVGLQGVLEAGRAQQYMKGLREIVGPGADADMSHLLDMGEAAAEDWGDESEPRSESETSSEAHPALVESLNQARWRILASVEAAQSEDAVMTLASEWHKIRQDFRKNDLDPGTTVDDAIKARCEVLGVGR